MQFGQSSLNAVIGTPLFMLVLLLFFWFLTSWIPPTPGSRRFELLITGILIVSTLLAEAGMIWLGWTPPWQETGIITPPASLLDLIVLPLLIGLVLAAWLVASLVGLLPAEKRYQFSLRHAALLGLACLLYEIGMFSFGWPAPWHLPIPSE